VWVWVCVCVDTGQHAEEDDHHGENGVAPEIHNQQMQQQQQQHQQPTGEERKDTYNEGKEAGESHSTYIQGRATTPQNIIDNHPRSPGHAKNHNNNNKKNKKKSLLRNRRLFRVFDPVEGVDEWESTDDYYVRIRGQPGDPYTPEQVLEANQEDLIREDGFDVGAPPSEDDDIPVDISSLLGFSNNLMVGETERALSRVKFQPNELFAKEQKEEGHHEQVNNNKDGQEDEENHYPTMTMGLGGGLLALESEVELDDDGRLIKQKTEKKRRMVVAKDDDAASSCEYGSSELSGTADEEVDMYPKESLYNIERLRAHGLERLRGGATEEEEEEEEDQEEQDNDDEAEGDGDGEGEEPAEEEDMLINEDEYDKSCEEYEEVGQDIEDRTDQQPPPAALQNVPDVDGGERSGETSDGTHGEEQNQEQQQQEEEQQEWVDIDASQQNDNVDAEGNEVVDEGAGGYNAEDIVIPDDDNNNNNNEEEEVDECVEQDEEDDGRYDDDDVAGVVPGGEEEEDQGGEYQGDDEDYDDQLDEEEYEIGDVCIDDAVNVDDKALEEDEANDHKDMEKDVDEMGISKKKKQLDIEIPAGSKVPREKDPATFYATAKQKITQAELTFNIHKHTYKNWKKRQQWKRKTAETVRLIREYAKKMMQVEDVEITNQLNEVMWRHGRRRQPVKIRLRMVRCYQAAGFTARGRPYPAREFVRVYYLHMDQWPYTYNHWMRGEQTIVTESGRFTKGIETDTLFKSGK